MPYNARPGRSRQRLIGLAVIGLFHAAIVYALAHGLGTQMVDIIKAPLEAKVVAELIKPPEPPKVEQPPPPKVVKRPPPAYVPPPKVMAAEPPPAAIAAISETPPPPAPPVPVPMTAEPPAKIVAKLDTTQRCPPPQYPAASRRAEESGAVVLKFLIDTDGKVLDSQIDTSSGFPRLDDAARTALAACQFKPGTVDGIPERSWARIRYVWKLQ